MACKDDLGLVALETMQGLSSQNFRQVLLGKFWSEHCFFKETVFRKRSDDKFIKIWVLVVVLLGLSHVNQSPISCAKVV